MASIELIIDDEFCNQMGCFFQKKGKEIDRYISQYIDILEKVKSNALLEGDTSKALRAYISYVKKLNKQIGQVSNSANTYVSNFLTRVDQTDQYLF